MDMDTEDDNRFTEQGVGSPVPVGVVSERAGSARPSSSACSALSIGNQVEVQDMATGTKDIPDPFKRRDSIPRSPPRGRSLSVPDVTTSMQDAACWAVDTEESMGSNPAKRKRQDASPNLEKDDMDDLIQRLHDKARELEALFKTNVNTKTGIKKAGMDILQTVLRLSRVNKKRPRNRTTTSTAIVGTQTEHETGEKQTQTVKPGATTSTKDSYTQTPDDIGKEIDDFSQTLRMEIDSGRSYDDYLAVCKKEWPKDVFQRVKETTGDIMSATWDYDLVNMTMEDLSMTKGVARRFRNQFGGLEELRSQREKLGGVAYMVNSITVPTEKGEERKDRYIWHMLIEQEPSQLALPDTVYASACRLKDLMMLHNRKKVALAFVSTYEKDLLQKTLEYVFRNTSVEIKLYKPEDTRRNRRKTEMTKGTTDRDKPTRQQRPVKDAVIVRAGAKTYADLVRELRRDVKLNDVGIEVSKMRKTRAGDLLLELKKGTADQLQLAISSQTKDAQVLKKTKQTVLHIMGMDEVTTLEEVQQAVREALGELPENCRVSSLRPAQAGTQNATVILDSNAAFKLIRMGSIKVGWLRCRIRERHDLGRCISCWDYGHKPVECKGPNRRDLCLKCSQGGHKAKDCKNEPFCPLCKTNGHQAGGRKCGRRPQLVPS